MTGDWVQEHCIMVNFMAYTSLQSISRMSKSGRACGRKRAQRNAYEHIALVVKLEGKRPLARPRHRFEGIRLILEKQWQAPVNIVMNI
jgi:hypothetical protein